MAGLSVWDLISPANTTARLPAVTQAHSIWDAESGSCAVVHTHDNLKNFFATISTDFALFVMMLYGIWKRRKAGALWKLVYRQGILWVAGAASGEVPVVVNLPYSCILLLLNLNDAMNLILQPFGLLAM
ncbi:hypothetical protein Clacol_001095 [Clathrus columnatus]|uniref:Uncharacterized protein n=1 Tax=Clathrus columnatus TaxID=1419009 RepID=A0AAV4ZXN3_9AGAM|nr:hypothetical protein Clacol_001095 [Clathrus columnatus]